MSNNLLINLKTKRQINDFVAKPSQGILVTGSTGSGKFMVALELSRQLLGLQTIEGLTQYPYFLHVARPTDRQEIPIELIRELIKKLQLKTPGKVSIRRIVIVEDANLLSVEAQNSLLKSLEEAPADTVLILTAANTSDLLPTIVSRLQRLQVQPISLKESQSHFKDNSSDKDIESAWLLSQGSAGLLAAVLGDSSHPLKQGVAEFKQFLSSNSYERLKQLDKLEKNKQDLANFIDGGSRIVSVLQKEAIKKEDKAQVSRWLKARKNLLKAKEQLSSNASPRLLSLWLVFGV